MINTQIFGEKKVNILSAPNSTSSGSVSLMGQTTPPHEAESMYDLDAQAWDIHEDSIECNFRQNTLRTKGT